MKKMITVLRKMQEADVEQSVKIATKCFNIQLTRNKLKEIKWEFEDAFDKSDTMKNVKPIYYVAENGGKVIGICGFSKSMMDWETFEIFWLCVDESFRKTGVGNRLMNKCEKEIREAGGLAIILSCKNNLINYYKGKKYKVAIKKKGDEVLMVKRLGAK